MAGMSRSCKSQMSRGRIQVKHRIKKQEQPVGKKGGCGRTNGQSPRISGQNMALLYYLNMGYRGQEVVYIQM